MSQYLKTEGSSILCLIHFMQIYVYRGINCTKFVTKSLVTGDNYTVIIRYRLEGFGNAVGIAFALRVQATGEAVDCEARSKGGARTEA